MLGEILFLILFRNNINKAEYYFLTCLYKLFLYIVMNIGRSPLRLHYIAMNQLREEKGGTGRKAALEMR